MAAGKRMSLNIMPLSNNHHKFNNHPGNPV
jgi:hypothetical protein